MSNHSNPATGKQLAYLRSLAEGTRTTFVTPRDRRHASREIERLRSLKRDNGSYPETTDEATREAVYATAPHAGEIEGFGASAKWRTSRRETTPRPAGRATTKSRAPRMTVREGVRAGLRPTRTVVERRGS